jgi:tyrosyl-tRNA synthetase
MKSELLAVLSERGFIHQATDLEALDNRASISKITAYIGFDCTAPSLHVGSLIQLQVLRWLHKLGHKPICLLGYATTQVGDPTGKDASRPMLSDDVIHNNLVGIRKTVSRVVPGVKFIKNDRWFNSTQSFIRFMRDYGAHFSVNRMLTLDVFDRRLSENKPLSYMEFAYPVMQAVDFLELFQNYGCVLQIGGSDQWGNILGGVELIRKVAGGGSLGLTTPLLTDSAGNKMGKTAGGQTIWLDPTMTTPFDFWQFWRNVEDDRVEPFMNLFTDLGGDVLDHVFGVNGPGINNAKKLLATEVTALVHGRDVANLCEQRASEVFGKANFSAIEPVAIPMTEQTYADILVQVGLAKSKGDADRLAAGGGVRLFGEPIANVRAIALGTELVLGVGKKRVVRILRG